MAIIAAAGVGALVAFLYFNVFGRGNKIFMGDGGSLVLGFIDRLLHDPLQRAEQEPADPLPYLFGPVRVDGHPCAIPLYDTIRVFVMRTMKGQSPFTPDRSHVHHILIDIGLSHRKAALVLILFNALCIGLAFALSALNFSVIKMLTILLVICFIAGETLHQVMLRKTRKNHKHEEHA